MRPNFVISPSKNWCHCSTKNKLKKKIYRKDCEFRYSTKKIYTMSVTIQVNNAKYYYEHMTHLWFSRKPKQDLLKLFIKKTVLLFTETPCFCMYTQIKYILKKYSKYKLFMNKKNSIICRNLHVGV